MWLVLVLCAMWSSPFWMVKVFTVYMQKSVDTFARSCAGREIAAGSAAKLPKGAGAERRKRVVHITWSKTGKIQLDQESRCRYP